MASQEGAGIGVTVGVGVGIKSNGLKYKKNPWLVIT